VLTNLLTVAVLGFFGVRLVGAARVSLRPPASTFARRIVRGIRWRHVWPVPFVLTAVVLVAYALLAIPVMRFGWWAALGGIGNPVTGGTEQTRGTALEWLVPLVFVALLAPSLPLFAHREEELFRRGCETWSTPKRIAKALLFGAVHAVIGIPIGFALALSVGGGYFQWCYLRGYRTTGSTGEALLESTRAHTAYNAVILGILVLGLLLLATGLG
jgi:hypothetical protein